MQIGDKVVIPSKTPRALPWWTVIAIIPTAEWDVPDRLFVLAMDTPTKYIVRREHQLQVVATAETVARVREDLAARFPTPSRRRDDGR